MNQSEMVNRIDILLHLIIEGSHGKVWQYAEEAHGLIHDLAYELAKAPVIGSGFEPVEP